VAILLAITVTAAVIKRAVAVTAVAIE